MLQLPVKRHSVSSCSSKGRCKKCKSSHHTLLHKELISKDCSLSLSSTASSEPSTPEPTIGIVHRPIQTFNVPRIAMTALALATAGIYERQCTIQLDTGAMLSLFSCKLARSIGAKKISGSSVTISGVGDMYSPYQVEFSLRSLKGVKHTTIRANVVDKISECQTIGQTPPLRELPEFQSLDLSDSGYNSSSRIDVLLRIGYCALCLLEGMVHSQDRTIVAMKTIFGWTLGGGCDPNSMESQSASTCLQVSPNHVNVEKLLKRFWHLEEPPCGDQPFTADEQEALTHFKDTVRRQPDGRYEASQPRRSPLPELGKS